MNGIEKHWDVSFNSTDLQCHYRTMQLTYNLYPILYQVFRIMHSSSSILSNSILSIHPIYFHPINSIFTILSDWKWKIYFSVSEKAWRYIVSFQECLCKMIRLRFVLYDLCTSGCNKIHEVFKYIKDKQIVLLKK